jgi:hypothetical protein
MIDEILKRHGLTWKQLNEAERQTLYGWSSALQQGQLSVEKIREGVAFMRDSVAKELVNEPEFSYILFFRIVNRRQILLKARLMNYMILESLLISPEKAKEKVEQAIAAMAPPAVG